MESVISSDVLDKKYYSHLKDL